MAEATAGSTLSSVRIRCAFAAIQRDTDLCAQVPFTRRVIGNPTDMSPPIIAIVGRGAIFSIVSTIAWVLRGYCTLNQTRLAQKIPAANSRFSARIPRPRDGTVASLRASWITSARKAKLIAG